MKALLAWFFVIASVASASGETYFCQPQGIAVDADYQEQATRVCQAVSKAEDLLASCQLPGIPDSLNIEVLDRLDADCMGVYHCGENAISILSERSMEALRSPGAFSHLTVEAYFESVVVHEVTHSAFSGLPCPFEACVVAQEYGAYALQIMSLSTSEREEFVQRSEIQGRVSSEELSAIYLYFAPNRFAQKVWAHLQQREDPCGYLQAIANGNVLLDRGRF